MEFPFSINNLFEEEISHLDNKLVPYKTSPSRNEYKSQLSEVIDKIGAASAKAQGLHGPITSASKMGYSDHHLYILKDAEANSGRGAAVGLLKVGYKKLFVYDHQNGHHEVEPLCVLDFYVHESCQRMGCGKKIFEAMLQEAQMKPHHLAIDRPSPKFLGFLQKHYNLKDYIPQVNNFVIFERFFKDRPAKTDRLRRGRGSGRPPAFPNMNSARAAGEDARHRRELNGTEVPGYVPTQLEKEKEALSNVTVGRGDPGQDTSGRPNSGGLAAHMYSRHGNSPSSQPGSRPGSNEGPRIGNVQASNMQTDMTPPSLRRDGPSRDYLKLHEQFGNARSYQDARGHLKISPGAPSTQNQTTPSVLNGQSSASQAQKRSNASAVPRSNPNLPPGDPYITRSAKPKQQDTTWNVFGTPSNKPSLSASSRKYENTRPW